MPKKLATKQAEAAERAAARAARTPLQQIKLIRTRPGFSIKERNRLKTQVTR